MLFNMILEGPIPVDKVISAGQTFEIANFNRKINRVALVGGTAVGEVELTINYGTQQQMVISNLSKGEPSPKKAFWDTSKIYCSRNTPIIIQVKKAIPSGKKFVLMLDIKRT
jgi:hypothetical protein